VVSSRDTSPAAAKVQAGIFRRMSAAERCALAVQMSTTARAVAAAGIRARHPGYDEAQVRFALLRLLLGDELFRRVYPHAPLVAP
jgi:hypothetical protein